MNHVDILRTDPRSLQQALADLRAKLKTLPLTHPSRGGIAQQIVGLEDELERRLSTSFRWNLS